MFDIFSVFQGTRFQSRVRILIFGSYLPVIWRTCSRFQTFLHYDRLMAVQPVTETGDHVVALWSAHLGIPMVVRLSLELNSSPFPRPGFTRIKNSLKCFQGGVYEEIL